jgi:hypothetical protein
MRTVMLAVVCGLVLAIAGSVALAEDKKEEKPKEVTLKGTIGCGKCAFKMDKKITGGKCINAIEVVSKKGDKEVKTIYVFIDGGDDEKYHKCTTKAKGSVTGVVSKKGDQMYITPSKDGVKFD